MRHLSDGTLRRWCDDRFAIANRERDHLDSCVRCQARARAVADDSALAARLLAADGSAAAPQATETQLQRVHARLAAGEKATRPLAPPRSRRRWLLGAAAVPVVAAGLLVTADAAGWLTIFSPTQVAPVVLTASDLNGLPDLSAYGRMTVHEPSSTAVAGAAAAAAASGLHVLQVSTLPADVPGAVHWEVIGHGTATFTIDSAAASAAAARSGRPAPVIPGALNGTSITVSGGPAVVAVYGTDHGGGAGGHEGLPTLVIAEGVRPTASTNGASLQQVQDFLLAQPGITPQLAAAIRAIGAPASTLPIPIISGSMTSRTVTLDGVPAVVAGDSTGLGAAVIWEKDGIVHAVGGTVAVDEVLNIARSLR